MPDPVERVPRLLAKGQYIRIRRLPTDEWMVGTVVLASGADISTRVEFQSVMVELQEPTRIHNGMLIRGFPLTVDYRTETVTCILDDEPYEVEVADTWLCLFSRRVISTEPDPDDAAFTKVTLECGHSPLVVCYTPCSHMPCSECLLGYVDTGKIPSETTPENPPV